MYIVTRLTVQITRKITESDLRKRCELLACCSLKKGWQTESLAAVMCKTENQFQRSNLNCINLTAQ